MSKGFIIGSGGGMSKGPIKKGTIVVTYPAGAVCTVTNGSKTYTALDTSGAAAFAVEPGTWTVRAYGADGDKSQTVTAPAGGWVEVGLSFWDGWIYKRGETYNGVTGGFGMPELSAGSRFNYGTATMNSDHIYMYCSGNHIACRATNNKINMRDKNTLYANIISSVAAANFIALIPSLEGDIDNTAIAITYFPAASDIVKVSLDISAIDDAYIAVAASGQSRTAKLFDMWCE